MCRLEPVSACARLRASRGLRPLRCVMTRLRTCPHTLLCYPTTPVERPDGPSVSSLSHCVRDQITQFSLAFGGVEIVSGSQLFYPSLEFGVCFLVKGAGCIRPGADIDGDVRWQRRRVVNAVRG